MIIDNIKKSIAIAMKAQDTIALNILRLVVGTSQQDGVETDSALEAIMRKIIKSNNETISFKVEKSDDWWELTAENSLLETFLPKLMSIDEIVELINKEGISLENPGRAIGSVMKAAKQQGLTTQGADVKKAISKLKLKMKQKIRICCVWDPDGADIIKEVSTGILHEYQSKGEFDELFAILVEEIIESLCIPNILPLSDYQSIDVSGNNDDKLSIDDFDLTIPVTPTDMSETTLDDMLEKIRDYITSNYDTCLQKARVRFSVEGS